MMLDTLAISRKLRKKGFNEVQAEALADAIHQKQENLSTKDDIAHLEDQIENVRGEIKHVEKELRGEIANVRTEIKHVEQVLGERISSVEQVLGERINSVGSRVTGLYGFMGIIGSAVVGQFVLALFS